MATGSICDRSPRDAPDDRRPARARVQAKAYTLEAKRTKKRSRRSEEEKAEQVGEVVSSPLPPHRPTALCLATAWPLPATSLQAYAEASPIVPRKVWA